MMKRIYFSLIFVMGGFLGFTNFAQAVYVDPTCTQATAAIPGMQVNPITCKFEAISNMNNCEECNKLRSQAALDAQSGFNSGGNSDGKASGKR